MRPQPLAHTGSVVTPVQFADYLRDRLGSDYQRALDLFLRFGENNSFKIANLLHQALNVGCLKDVLDDLDKWADMAYRTDGTTLSAALLVQREVDTRKYIDVIYGNRFPSPFDDGPAGGRSRLLTPGQVRPRPSSKLIVPHTFGK